MAVTFRSVGVSPGADSDSCVIVKPAGLAVGDLMVAQVVGTGDVGIFTAPGGWTGIRQDKYTTTLGSALFWKIAVQADVDAANFTFTATDATNNRGTITAWYGHDSTTPINANSGQTTFYSTTVTAPTITPSVANCVVCLFCAILDDNTQNGYAIATDNPASWTEAYDLPSDLPTDLGLSMGYATRPETSATGNGTATTSDPDSNIGQLVAIAPLVEAIPVSDELQAIWAIREVVSDTSQLVYNIRALVSDTVQGIWNVKVAISDTVQAIWNVLSIFTVGDTVQLVWNIKAVVSDALQSIWGVRTLASKTVELVYGVRTFISSTVQSLWSIRELSSNTSQLVWNIKAAISNKVQPLWDIRKLLSDTLESKWGLRAAVSNTVQVVWGIRIVISETLQVVWNVRWVRYFKKFRLHPYAFSPKRTVKK